MKRWLVILGLGWLALLGSTFTAVTLWGQVINNGVWVWSEPNRLILWIEAIIFALPLVAFIWWAIWKVESGD